MKKTLTGLIIIVCVTVGIQTTLSAAQGNTGNIELSVPQDADPDDYYLEIKNETLATIDFSLKLNGNFSLNNADLIAMIRALPEAYKGEPDYVKVWRYIVANRYHSAPLCGQYYQHDPSFFMNSMGFGLCDDVANIAAMLWRYMGYKSRVWGLSGHVVPEIQINNRWELYDPDLEVIYYKQNGQVAGIEDLAKNPDLVTHPVRKISKHPGAYCENVKNIYATTANNKLTEKGLKGHYTRDFIFSIPSDGTLAIGAVFYHKDLKLFGKKNIAKKISHARLTIPAHWHGILDIPLPVHTILGSANDSVTIKGTKLKVASVELGKYLDRRTIPGVKSLGTEPAPIEINDNNQPIEIIYLLNPCFTKLKQINKLQLLGKDIDKLTASLKLKNPQSLLGYWKLDDGTGRTAIDSGPNEATAALLNNTEWTSEGKIGNAIRFKGAIGALKLKNCHLADCFKPGKSFTVQLWLKPDSITSKRASIFSTYLFDIDLRGDRILTYFKDANNKYASFWGKTKILRDHWTHLTATYKSTVEGKAVTTLYINGKECGTKQSLSMKSNFPVRGPYIGFTPNGGGYYFNGIIDEVKIWSKALTPKEIEDKIKELK